MGKLQRKVAVITGGTEGIELDIAIHRRNCADSFSVSMFANSFGGNDYS